jgi:hypothetical protein
MVNSLVLALVLVLAITNTITSSPVAFNSNLAKPPSLPSNPQPSPSLSPP